MYFLSCLLAKAFVSHKLWSKQSHREVGFRIPQQFMGEACCPFPEIVLNKKWQFFSKHIFVSILLDIQGVLWGGWLAGRGGGSKSNLLSILPELLSLVYYYHLLAIVPELFLGRTTLEKPLVCTLTPTMIFFFVSSFFNKIPSKNRIHNKMPLMIQSTIQ